MASSSRDPDPALRPPPVSLAGAPFLADRRLVRLVSALAVDGDAARVVGGAVRNSLLSLPVSDVDIATTATPDRVIARAAAAHFKPVPTGVAHGTVTVVVDGHPFEVTTLRQDVATDGRRAKVEFGRDWRADAERRDFTTNALFADLDGTIHDYVGGVADCLARRVRFIGSPRQRIREDFLRILRFFRFHAAYGAGPPDAAGLAACLIERDGLARLSAERVRAELLKLLVAPGAVETLAQMADAGILVDVIGGVPRLMRFARLAGIEAGLGRAPDGLMRLGGLSLFVAEDAERLAIRLRLSRAEGERLMRLASVQAPTPVLPAHQRRVALYRLGSEAFVDAALLAWADDGAPPDDPDWRDLVAFGRIWQPPRFPVSGKMLVARGVAPGPDVGRALQRIEAAWQAADFPTSAAEIETIVQQVLSNE